MSTIIVIELRNEFGFPKLVERQQENKNEIPQQHKPSYVIVDSDGEAEDYYPQLGVV